VKTAKQLISADNHSNTANYKFTYVADIAMVCKDDLVALPLKLARQLGNMPPLCLVTQVSSSIHVIDPFSMQRAEIDNDKYWRYPFKALRSAKALTEYTVLDTSPMQMPSKAGAPAQPRRLQLMDVNNRRCKMRLAEMEVVRNSDFGTFFETKSSSNE
jgi:nonsense-mediated mRNA decay protein 3